MPHPLEQLRDEALRQIESATDEQALETTRVKYLGRSGSISSWGEKMKALAKEEKPVVGKLLNEVRNAVTAAIESRNAQFHLQKESGALAKIDISLPGTPHEIGSLHPLHQMHEPVLCIRFTKCTSVEFKFFDEWVSLSPKVPMSKPNGTASML